MVETRCIPYTPKSRALKQPAQLFKEQKHIYLSIFYFEDFALR